MIHKRPFVDDDSNEVSYKHPRNLEQIDHLSQPVPVCQNPALSDGEYSLGDIEDIGWSSNDQIVSSEFKKFEIGASSSFPPIFWISNGIHEADNLSFLEYFDHVNQPRALLPPDDVVSSIDYLYQKPVSIGHEHQVFVPEWEGHEHQVFVPEWEDRNSSSSSRVVTTDAGYEERLMGTCVIPFPEAETSNNHCGEGTMSDCSCLDKGSTECVKQHVMEARQKLRDNLGEEAFEGLGFNDMGEDVAKKWSEVEEQVFHDVVLSNPVLMGRNFWEHLTVALPLREKRELVSYYFNVFMLRLRSEQNRFDPLNIDSDNDDWQRNDSGIAERDDDDTVESPNEQDPPANCKEDLVDCNEQTTEEDEDEICAITERPDCDVRRADCDVRRAETDEEYEGDIDIDDNSMAHGISSVDYGGYSGFKLSKNSGNGVDVEDGSCTSYEYQQDSADCCVHDMSSGGRHSKQE